MSYGTCSDANRNHIAVYVSAKKQAKSIEEENRKRYVDRAITRNKRKSILESRWSLGDYLEEKKAAGCAIVDRRGEEKKKKGNDPRRICAVAFSREEKEEDKESARG